jgi:hypothetical protein
MLEKAIKKINQNAEFSINADDINQITWLNGTTPISKSEIEAMIPVVQQEQENKIATELANKQSALTKLSSLGLTEAEIKSIIG